MSDKWIWGAENWGNGWQVKNKNNPEESWHFGMSSDAEKLWNVLNNYENSTPNSHKPAKELIEQVHQEFAKYLPRMNLGENLLMERIFERIYKVLEDE